MLSQVAERLYWFARYVERTETTARLMLVRHQLVLDLPENIQPEWRILVDTLGVGEEFDARLKKASEKNVIGYIFGDRENASSILSSIMLARENMRTSREVLPTETWERLNSLYLSVARRAGKVFPQADRYKVLNNIIQTCQQITGALLGTMNHDEAYQFIRLGRSVERADMTTRILDFATIQLEGDEDEINPYRNVLWMSVLRSLSAYQMYRLHVKRKVSREDVLSFLLVGKVFPRAVIHCLNEMQSSFDLLPSHKYSMPSVDVVKLKLEKENLEELKDQRLHDFIDELQAELGLVHLSIRDAWFNSDEKS